jgi:hypothetical protein
MIISLSDLIPAPHLIRRNRRGFSAGSKAKGAMKDAFGKMTGDPVLQVEGKIDKEQRGARNARRRQGPRSKE